MIRITGYRAFWHPSQNTFGIAVRLETDAGKERPLQIGTPEEFIAVLAVLNGPSPAMTSNGHITCER